MIVLKKNKKAEPCWGLTTEYITDEMIEALKHGKRLYFVIGAEYAVVIKYKKKQ